MRLNEEYLQRHNIVVPTIRHVSLGYLVLRYPGENFFDWDVVAIEWEEPTSHVGTYHLKFFRPHKTDIDSNFLHQIGEDIVLRWDEYEDFMWTWSKSLQQGAIISDPMQLVLTVWEMYVYSHDAYFADNYSHLSDLLFQSLDFNSSLAHRYDGYVRFLKSVDTKRSPFSYWNEHLSRITKNYSSWLAKLHV